MKRYFTVLCPFDPVKRDVAGRIFKPLLDANIPDMELVFVCRSKFEFKLDNVTVVEVDDETAESDSKLKNIVIKKFYEEHGNSEGWLYIMDDFIEITNAPGFETFFVDLERMLDVYGMNAWLNTRTDGMNHVFNVYNPRYTVTADNELMKEALASDKPVYWTSHANTSFMALNLKEHNWKRFLFDEAFTIPMYYIIDWICRQKEENEKLETENSEPPRWHWMNLYPTVQSEGELFRLTEWEKLGIDEKSWKEPKYREDQGRDEFQKEQKEFETRNHNIAATGNPDPAFVMMYKRFKLVKELKNA